MADDGDDFVFDEDGIYRERALDDQDFLDEDGIWRDDLDDDDLDDDKDPLDHYTFRTDSGLGTADRRSSVSTLGKVPITAFDRGRYGGSIDLHYDDDFGDNHRGSYPVGEKSLNISDLEASASVIGDYDFEHVSIDSNAEVDLPELNDGISGGSSDRTRTDPDVGDLNDFEDFEGNESKDSTGLFDSSLNGPLGHSSSRRSRPSYGLNDSLDPIHVTRTRSFDDSFRFQEPNPISHRNRRASDLDSDRHSQQPEQLSQPRERGNHQTIADYLLSGGENNYHSRTSDLSAQELRDEVGQLPSRPPIVGDSIFTQDDPEVLSYHNRHSLMEFERLEAALDVGDAHSEKSGDQMDLIGAYLQGLQDQEDEEENQSEWTQSYTQEGYKQQRQKLVDNSKQASVESRSTRQGSFERQISAQNDRHPRNDSVEFQMSEDSSPERSRKISRSNAIERTDTQESQPLQDTQSTRSVPQAEVHGLLNKADGQQESFEAANNTIPFDESISLLENQQPPFDSMSFSTLDMTGGTNEAMSRNATMSEANNSSRVSKIPMLRSRSPSMTRPGSTSPNRSRTQTPDRTRGRMKHSERRALPQTPSRSMSQESQPHPVVQRESSREGSFQREVSIERDYDGEHSIRARFSEEEESELDKAASLLLGETDPIDLAAIVPTNQPPKSKPSMDQRGRRKSSASTVGSRPGSARAQRQVSTSSTKVRPSSAEGIRSASKRDFKIRGAASGSLGSQPLRAIGREVEEADRALQEAQQRQLNEETLKQLQQDYNTLLQKYAQAENTIDSLRIGATIPISVELTATGGGTGPQGASGGPAQPPTAAPPGGGSLSNSVNATRAKPGHGSRPGSARSQRSNSVQIGQGSGLLGQLPGTDQVNLAASLSGEGDKLSLLAKAKAVEEKTNALAILLEENCLSTADQVKALQNIRDSHEQLQQEYRDARAQHDYMVRTGALPQDGPGFDSDKAIEGELYKLGMQMDDLEQQVQENVKVRSSSRVPFKADHSINVNGMGAKAEGTETSQDLAPNRPPSVGSFAGGPEDIDEQLHRLTKDYNQLMDRYRRLKQLKKTPERDLEIDGLLKNLRRIYEQTPDHRKPALPPELENHYNPVKDNFMSSESEAPRRGSLAMYSSKGQETDSLPGLNESDLSIGRHTRGHHPQRKSSLDYTSSATDSTLRQKRQKRIPIRPPLAPASYDSFDSATSSPSRKSESSAHRGRYPGLPPNSKRREREDKDSGYVGSEASRKVANQGQDKDRSNPTQSLRRSTRSLPRSDRGAGGASDVTQSTSDLSTVENVRPHRPAGTGRTNKKANSSNDGEGLVAVTGGGNKSRLKNGRAASDPALARRSMLGRSTGDVTDSDVSSQGSQTTNRSRPSVKSEQIQTLADEINKLRAEMRTRDNNPVMPVAANQTTSQAPQAVAASAAQPTQAGQQYAYVYSYPYQDNVQPQQTQQPPGSIVYAAQPAATPVAASHVLAPGVPVGTVVQPSAYGDPYAAPVVDYREYQEPRPVEHWETYAPRHDYDNRDHDRRSGYYSDDGNHRSRDRDRERERERERKRRLRDYYIPSRGQPGSSAHDTYSRREPRPDRGRYGYSGDPGYYPADNRYPATSAYNSGRPVGPPPGAMPPTYQQVRRVASCNTCGGTGQHSHGDYVYVPQPQPATAVQPQQQQTGTGYVLVPTVQAQQTVSQPQVQPVQNTTAYIPVQMVEKPVNPKVRYYVREYGSSDAGVTPLRRSYSLGNLTRVGKKVKHIVLEDAVSDSEGHDDLNDSLNSALQTASELKIMSRRMKKTLKTELDQSLRGSLRAMAY